MALEPISMVLEANSMELEAISTTLGTVSTVLEAVGTFAGLFRLKGIGPFYLITSMKILAISGSLRNPSSTHLVLQHIASLVPKDIVFEVYESTGDLPHFDDSPRPPVEVEKWRKALQEADALLICTPEYAFGVPGSLKNAIDWTVGSGEFVDKPTALVTAATGGEKAHAALLMILTALSAHVKEDGALLISFVRSKMDKEGRITHVETLLQLEKVVNALVSSIKASV